MALKDILDKLAPTIIEAMMQEGMKKKGIDVSGKKVAVLDLHGAIMAGNPKQINLASVQPKLDAISKMSDVQAIALDINSPGGSPVQSRQVADAIMNTAQEMGVPVYAFVQDVAASGGYWIACAADEIYVQPESIVGSVGVVSAGFGFHELLEKVGVERRVYTAGESKVTNDPFQPENPAGVEKGNALREEIHENFIGWVQSRRDDAINSAPKQGEKLFEADVFTGQAAVQNGLADKIGGMRVTMQQMFGMDVKFTKPMVLPAGLPGLFQMAATGFDNAAHSIGRGVADAALDRVEQDVSTQHLRFK